MREVQGPPDCLRSRKYNMEWRTASLPYATGLIACLYSPSIIFRAFRNTEWNIGRVRKPVWVFRWLG